MKIKTVTKIFLAILIFFVATGACAYAFLGRVKTVEIPKTDSDLGIKQIESTDSIEQIKKDDERDKIINIALLGGDGRNKSDSGRTDAILILSIDKLHNKIKLSSVMRDTYVDVYNHGKTKLNHAFSYGGPQLMIRTLNEIFDLNIKDYVYIDFFGLEKLVDAMSGVQVDVKQSHISELNKYIEEVAKIKKSRPHLIKKPGLQNLDGAQTLSYVRIRHVGDGDFDRTERQREVLSILFEKVKKSGPLKYPSLVYKILPYIETSLDKGDIVNLGTDILTAGISTIEQDRFPLDGYCKGEIVNGGWYLVTDLEITRNHLHQFIYDDIKPMPGKPLF
jgi:polyisoprenyl-teichoic acid--peptidoglycan teichoic acid transferase